MRLRHLVFALATLSVAAAQTTTPNLNLTLPNIGAPNWGVTLNNDFTLIDTFAGTVQKFAGLSPDNFNWSQSPTSSLTTPGANFVTLNPCPQGIDGTDTWTYVHIGTVGTPEDALITGGSCVSGVATGTINITTVNAHAAGYTIGSSSQGWQEASNAARFIPTNPTAPAQGGVVTATAGKEYAWSARVTVRASFQTLDFSGSIIDCNMNDTCLYVGDPTGGLVADASVLNFRGRAGIANGTNPMIEDSAQGTKLNGVYNRLPLSGNTFGYYIKSDNDQAAHFWHIDTNLSSGSGIRCDNTFCGAAVYAPGPFSVNASVIWIDHSNLSLECLGNGIDDQQGNTLHVSDSVIQAFNQFGVRSSATSGGFGAVVLDNVYMEVGNCTNPTFSGNVQAASGIIADGGDVFIRGGTQNLSGAIPHYTTGTGSGTRLNFFVAAIDSILGKSNFIPVGFSTNTGGTITLQWPKVTGTNTITYDGVEVPGAAPTINAIPLGTLPGGATGSASGTVFTGMAQCAGPICSATVNLASALGGPYVIPITPIYFPLLTFWPGTMVLSAKLDTTATTNLPVAFADTVNFFEAPLVAETNSTVALHVTECQQFPFPPNVNTLMDCRIPVPAIAAALPACTSAIEGMQLMVSDASGTTWGALVSGGGTQAAKVTCNGSSWTVMGK